MTGTIVASVEASSGPKPPSRRARAAVVVPIKGDRLAHGFGAELVIYRDGLELTQAELAARSGVSASWICAFEAGRGRSSGGGTMWRPATRRTCCCEPFLPGGHDLVCRRRPGPRGGPTACWSSRLGCWGNSLRSDPLGWSAI
ncbi:helix-turn-helix domain-containing protein [Pseudonocardia yunnanensis]|uniref:Helix-turn-helix domain-containing protein n=1 Tax=Pseudonocardia yunnanensis TaxID=58107 RepID=A0ABW4EQ97_9PSEU